MDRLRISLGALSALTLLGLAVLLGVQFALVNDASRRSVLAMSEQVRQTAAEAAAERVSAYLEGARDALVDVEAQVAYGLVDPGDPVSMRHALVAELLANPDLDEVTFTHASQIGWTDDGDALLGDDRWQVSALRRDGIEVHDAGSRDPTEHLTFQVTASRGLRERVTGPEGGLWTDLHWSEADAALPEAERRVVVTVMRVLDHDGFRGVLRAGVLAERLDAVVGKPFPDADDPHVAILADTEGRPITRLSGMGALEVQTDDSLRASSTGLPPAVAAALRSPSLALAASGPQSALLDDHLATWVPLPRSQDWVLVLVVPKAFYLGDLERLRIRLLLASGVVLLMALAMGMAQVRAVQLGLRRIVGATERMRELEFGASPARSGLREVGTVLESLELAKTALRAMGRYVPVDLVRLLYRSGREPVLGGEVALVTIMFTDIAGFTAVSEKLTPTGLAEALGHYLDAMTTAIHATGGVIDKYVGDAVMALWNAPVPVDDAPSRACAAAIRCLAAVEALRTTRPQDPPFPTRFGLHVDTVLVGHFGSHERMSWTVLGDGVNLASRLEGLNKQYGTTVLASAAIVERAKGYAFREVDRVAVKGRAGGVAVYELLPDGRTDAHDRYESALAAYRARRFDDALALLGDDGPSRTLAERCNAFVADPPPPDWDGTWSATHK